MQSGLRNLQVYDPDLGITFPAVVQYPTMEPTLGMEIGPYHFDATRDAAIAPGRFPVCLISHGGGGSHLLYRTIATHLARCGYIVVSPEHPRDNRNDNTLTGTDVSAVNRPKHASLAIDAVLDSPFFMASASASAVVAIGHSMGGYTVLALAGGQPWSRSGQPLTVNRDSRIKAAVLMAPSTDWYLAPNSLEAISIPLLVLAGQKDQITPLAKMQQALDRLPNTRRSTLEVIENAGHFSFLSPFPIQMRRPDFAPSVDPEGFDREQFHLDLSERIEKFFSPTLKESLTSQ